MPNYKNYFRGKKVTVMGLGLLGRGVGDTAFLAERGAKLTVTDLKTKEQLKSSILKLARYKNIKYVLGKHRLEDFSNKDFILKSADVKPDSPYLAYARKNKVPVEMSASLFAKISQIPTIGITGTRGKSTVAHLIYHILKTAGKDVLLGGNVVGVSNLQLLKKVRKNTIAVLELDSWQLQGFGESKISPNISVFTTFLDDHLTYYKGNRKTYFEDKANIFKFQEKGDVLIVGKQVLPSLKKWGGKVRSKKIIAQSKIAGFTATLIGEHNEYNIALAITLARFIGLEDSLIKKAVKSFKGVPGRLELVRKAKGITFYNDTTATTSDATIAALKALSRLLVAKSRGVLNRKIILIAGGSDKNLNMSGLIKEIPKYCKSVILLSGTGTDKLVNDLGFKNYDVIVNSMKEAVGFALSKAKEGDIVILSPAFASFGLFKNEYDRGEQFVNLVKRI